MSPLLCGGLSVAYGGVRAVNEVDIAIEPVQIVELIGPNGAGKTSLIDGLSGFAHMTGRATFKGISLSGLRPHQRVALGLLRTWQSVKLFDDLTVIENLQVPAARSSWRALLTDLAGLGRDASRDTAPWSFLAWTTWRRRGRESSRMGSASGRRGPRRRRPF